MGMYVANPENVPHFGKNNRITPPLQPALLRSCPFVGQSVARAGDPPSLKTDAAKEIVKALLRKAEGYGPPNWDCSNS